MLLDVWLPPSPGRRIVAQAPEACSLFPAHKPAGSSESCAPRRGCWMLHAFDRTPKLSSNPGWRQARSFTLIMGYHYQRTLKALLDTRRSTCRLSSFFPAAGKNITQRWFSVCINSLDHGKIPRVSRWMRHRGVAVQVNGKANPMTKFGVVLTSIMNILPGSMSSHIKDWRHQLSDQELFVGPAPWSADYWWLCGDSWPGSETPTPPVLTVSQAKGPECVTHSVLWALTAAQTLECLGTVFKGPPIISEKGKTHFI